MNNQFWAELDDERCPCRGGGWAQTDVEQWKECPIHYHGQLHPQSRNLLLDDPEAMQEEDRKSQLRYKIKACRAAIAHHQDAVKEQQKLLVQFELELINKTATVKMQAVNPNTSVVEEIEISDGDFI